MTMEKRDLHNYAVVNKAFHKWVRKALGNLYTIVVIRLMANIQNRLLYLSYTMTEEINSYHRNTVAMRVGVLDDIVGIGILRAEILAEA